MTEASIVIQKLFDTLDDEKTGAQAKRGFKYQDWWCTGKIFSLWADEKSTDFAIGIEIKEDAIVIDSISSPKKLVFYQIKKRENKQWSLSDLIRVETQEKSTISKLYSKFKVWQPLQSTDIQLHFITNSSLKLETETKRKFLFHKNINFGNDLSERDQNIVKSSLKAQLLIDENEKIELNRINFEQIGLPVDDTDIHIYGMIYNLNSEYKFPIYIKNINVAANHITNIFTKLSTNIEYANNFSKLLTRCLTRSQFDEIITIIEKNFINPEDILSKGFKKLEIEHYPHRQLQKLEIPSKELLLDLRDRSNSKIQELFKSIHYYYNNNEIILDEIENFSNIVNHVSNEIFNKKNNGFFSKEYIKCSVILYDISNGEIYCEKFFNI